MAYARVSKGVAIQPRGNTATRSQPVYPGYTGWEAYAATTAEVLRASASIGSGLCSK
jgi:hypothetical protein